MVRDCRDLTTETATTANTNTEAIISTTKTTTISKSSFHIKQSPDTSRVTTPIHNLSSVIKYETGDDINVNLTFDKKMQLQQTQQQSLSHLLPDSEKTEGEEEEGVEGEEGEIEDYDEDEQPCDLRLQHSLKIMSLALQQAAAAGTGGPDVITSGCGSTKHTPSDATAAAAAAAAAMAVMIGSGGGGGGGTGTTSVIGLSPNSVNNFPPTHAHTSLANFTATNLAPRSVSLLPSGLASNLDLTPSDGNVSITITSTTTSSITSSSTAGSIVTSIPPTSVATSSAVSVGVVGSGGSWGGAYTCERCGNSYARPHSLNRHVRFECGVEPKFECPICHKKSKHKHNLVLHMRTHQHR